MQLPLNLRGHKYLSAGHGPLHMGVIRKSFVALIIRLFHCGVLPDLSIASGQNRVDQRIGPIISFPIVLNLIGRYLGINRSCIGGPLCCVDNLIDVSRDRL